MSIGDIFWVRNGGVCPLLLLALESIWYMLPQSLSLCSSVALEGIANILNRSDISLYGFGVVYLFAR